MLKKQDFVIDMQSVFELCRSRRQTCYFETVSQRSFQIVLTTLAYVKFCFTILHCSFKRRFLCVRLILLKNICARPYIFAFLSNYLDPRSVTYIFKELNLTWPIIKRRDTEVLGIVIFAIFDLFLRFVVQFSVQFINNYWMRFL